MEKGKVYLSYYQVMLFMYRIDEFRKENPNFNDGIAASFEDYMIFRAGEIDSQRPIILKIFPDTGKYILSESMFKYLLALTGVDPFDEPTMKKYIPLIQKVEEIARSKIV